MGKEFDTQTEASAPAASVQSEGAGAAVADPSSAPDRVRALNPDARAEKARKERLRRKLIKMKAQNPGRLERLLAEEDAEPGAKEPKDTGAPAAEKVAPEPAQRKGWPSAHAIAELTPLAEMIVVGLQLSASGTRYADGFLPREIEMKSKSGEKTKVTVDPAEKLTAATAACLAKYLPNFEVGPEAELAAVALMFFGLSGAMHAKEAWDKSQKEAAALA